MLDIEKESSKYQMKQAAMLYPIQTQSHDCHHDRPGLAAIIDDDIIQVLMLNESADRSVSPVDIVKKKLFQHTDPETNEIPSTPLPSLRLNGLEIMVEQHELCGSEAIFTRHRKLVGPVSHLAVL
jgi:hypothetical protein